MATVVRYREQDCLHAIFVDLCEAVATFQPWDADERERWMEAVVWLLRQVPDPVQRAAWGLTLVASINRTPAPVVLLLEDLWRRVERVEMP